MYRPTQYAGFLGKAVASGGKLLRGTGEAAKRAGWLRGARLGSALGTVAGGASGYRRSREQGHGLGRSLLGAAGGGAVGAGGGALVGGVTGGVFKRALVPGGKALSGLGSTTIKTGRGWAAKSIRASRAAKQAAKQAAAPLSHGIQPMFGYGYNQYPHTESNMYKQFYEGPNFVSGPEASSFKAAAARGRWVNEGNSLSHVERRGLLSRLAGTPKAAAQGTGRGVARTLEAIRLQKAGGHIRRHSGKYGTGALALGALAAAEGARRVIKSRRNKRDYELNYAIHPETGQVYAHDEHGQPVLIGEVQLYNELLEEGNTDQLGVDGGNYTGGNAADPNDLPASEEGSGRPNLTIDPEAVGGEAWEDEGISEDPGEPETDLVEPLAREESDQFSVSELAQLYEAGYIDDTGNWTQAAYEDGLLGGVENYAGSEQVEAYAELQQKVDRLENANYLLQAGKQAEEYRAYLTELKKLGYAAVGDIDSQVDYMMGLNQEQVQGYMDQLESSVRLTGLTERTPMGYSDANDVAADFAQNQEEYARLGITEKDLQYADMLKHNGETIARG